MIVKICGLTRAADARMAVAAGADWLGINFWPRSTRWVNIEGGIAVAEAARATSPTVTLVGVFVNQPALGIEDIVRRVGLDFVQLHGDETPDDCRRFGHRAIKAIALAEDADVARIRDYPCDTVLIDTPTPGYGGSGQTFDWSLAARAAAGGKRIVLAGGLGPDNVADAVAAVTPYGVDVASGVESEPGIKDQDLVRRFIAVAKGQA